MAVLNVWLKQIRPVHAAFLIPGTVSAVVFAYFYLIASRGDCGVVRFYEYIIGIAGLALWLAGTVPGFILLANKSPAASGIGTALIAVTNTLMVIAVSVLIYSYLDNNFYFTTTKQLMENVATKDDILAALELGKRKEKKAVPLLCRIVQDNSKDINLRFNAIRSLGSIGLSPDHVYYDRMMLCLTETLEDQKLRAESAKILGKLADKQAVLPLLDVLSKEKDEFVKTDIIRSLGMIKDKRACEPLHNLLRENENSGYMLRSAIKEALTKMENSEKENCGQ
ncbi:MAG: HEAT repeat domain-containing protein [Desulfococcaceae bacterium]